MQQRYVSMENRVYLQWKQTANVLQIFNDWFDLFNINMDIVTPLTCIWYEFRKTKYTILDNMNDFIQAMRVEKRSALLQFQKGIVLCNKSLCDMFVYI